VSGLVGAAGLAESITVGLPELRAFRELFMSARLLVTRLSGVAVTDPSTGVITQDVVVLYDGAGLIATHNPYEQTHDVGGALVVTQRYYAAFPVAAFSPVDGDVIEVVSSAVNPVLVGRRYRVAAPMAIANPTALRVFVDEIGRGKEGS
jgi:hypothetical protein